MSKRLVWVPNENVFKYFLMNRHIDIDSIPTEGDVRQMVEDMSTGCFVIGLKKGELSEGIVMHKFPKAVNMMVSRENIHGLHLRYLSKAERESVAEMFDLNK